jgi:DNA primase
MGTALTETQLKLVAPRMARKVIMALDSDAAGQNATRRSLEVAREALRADFGGKLGVEFRVLIVPDGKDPDDFIRAHPGGWPALVDEAQPVAEFVIALESAGLTDRSTVAEKEEVARRVLPLLSASENELYRQDNVQKLAMRLKIGERQLMTWAADHRPAEQPRRSEPPLPDEPPPDLEDFWLGDEEDAPAPAARPSSALRELALLEAYLLKALYEQPELIYDINRRFRELAGPDLLLQGGPLCDLCAEDFTRAANQGLLMLLHDALAQDEQAFAEYTRDRLGEAPELRAELERAQSDEFARTVPALAQKSDLPVVLKQWKLYSSVVDAREEAIRSALRLREERIARERAELRFVFEDLPDAEQSDWNHRVGLTVRAKGLIDSHFLRANAGLGSRSMGR